MKKLLLVAAIAGAIPFAAQAESNFTSAASGALSATARLNFTVTIPRVMYLQVGTGTNFSTVSTVDGLTFTVPGASVGAGGAIAGAGGDLTGGAVTVRVLGNAGNLSLNSGVTGQLSNGTNTIPWSAITVTAAPLTAGTTAGFTNAAITHPAFSATTGAGPTATAFTAVNTVVRQESKWTFAYDNTGVYAPGTYGATVANNGVVTYTLTSP
ncbi:hypothetical protein SAMN05518854_10817 [Variovorax sp. YR266]|uniref:hypothetical protein n=1 Tax=Variovorax sp. YR266 TaxID=1884386 RepID=UPI000899229F|nr:hypothetical protein [Variovorax sp. YR266]SDZ58337.1 hypothetical protein SAMN05518854_10817 [Variovorax sp. YR266]